MRNKYVITYHILAVVLWFASVILYAFDLGGGVAHMVGLLAFLAMVVTWVWTVVNMYLSGNHPRRSPARQRLGMD